MNPKENLPQQICDLCIVQLNVSYNFKRLALKNDFQIRQYMIENGMSLMKDDDDRMETTTTTTELEIHQIHHNVIRTNRFRQITAPELRRNSTISSVSGTSTMIINGRESDAAPSAASNFVTPRPVIRPIQVKTEPIDPDEEERKNESPETSSPSNASEPVSIVTVSSTNPRQKTQTPMVVINGIINNESFAANPSEPETYSPSKPAPLSVKVGRAKRAAASIQEEKREKLRNLRTIKKKSGRVEQKLKKILQRESPRNKSAKVNVAPKKDVVEHVPRGPRNNANVTQKTRGRPRKLPGTPKMTYTKRNNGKKRSWDMFNRITRFQSIINTRYRKLVMIHRNHKYLKW